MPCTGRLKFLFCLDLRSSQVEGSSVLRQESSKHTWTSWTSAPPSEGSCVCNADSNIPWTNSFDQNMLPGSSWMNMGSCCIIIAHVDSLTGMSCKDACHKCLLRTQGWYGSGLQSQTIWVSIAHGQPPELKNQMAFLHMVRRQPSWSWEQLN
jgi:hypothetical protein